MPNYDYECLTCWSRFEASRLMEDRDASIECPACGSYATDRLITSPATHFKGTGFYTTDKDKK